MTKLKIDPFYLSMKGFFLLVNVHNRQFIKEFQKLGTLDIMR